MPQLESTNYESELIRMYYPFPISTAEMDAFRARSRVVVQFATEKAVITICKNCILSGYYIVGLERVELRTEHQESGLSLSLRVRRFADKLTTDEIFDWTRKSVERVLFEMRQLMVEKE